MNDDKLYLGIDYGGNGVKMGLVDGLGQLSGDYVRPTANLKGEVECRAFAAEVADFVHNRGVYSSELGGVGLAIPGIVEDDYLTPNVNTDWPLLISCLTHTFNKQPVVVLNDANAAALGELWLGAAEHRQSVLLVTLGSGIGSGLVVDGRVVSGMHGAAGEIGHMTVVPGGRLCSCGRRGCIERYASARGLVTSFNEAAEVLSLTAEELQPFEMFQPQNETDAIAVFDAARAGDPRAVYAVKDMADKLGFALSQAACLLDPAIILLGGGLSASSDLFIDDLLEAFHKYCFPSSRDIEIKRASLDGREGVIGAARYAMLKAADQQELEENPY